jgi:hypothetical protein
VSEHIASPSDALTSRSLLSPLSGLLLARRPSFRQEGSFHRMEDLLLSASTAATPDVLNLMVKKAFEMAYDLDSPVLEEPSAEYDQRPRISHSLVVGEGSHGCERDLARTDSGKDAVP